MTEQSRPKPIELVAMTLAALSLDLNGNDAPVSMDNIIERRWPNYLPHAQAAFDILIKHGCISIEGIIARDEELARVAPVPERAGET